MAPPQKNIGKSIKNLIEIINTTKLLLERFVLSSCNNRLQV